MKTYVKALTKPCKLWANVKWRYLAKSSNKPFLFVVGAPRSGTTLLYSTLRAHPDIAGADDETYFFTLRNYKKESFEGFTWSGSLTPEEYNQLLSTSRDLVHQYERIADHFLAKGGSLLFVEKTPSHLFQLNYLFKKFPNANVINMIRDGRDCYLSHLKLEGHLHRDLKDFAYFWKEYIRYRKKFSEHS